MRAESNGSIGTAFSQRALANSSVTRLCAPNVIEYFANPENKVRHVVKRMVELRGSENYSLTGE